MLSYVRAAITANGGTPQSFRLVDAWRELVEAYGGTPTKYSVLGLMREAITAVGGTPTKVTEKALLKELLTALGESATSHNMRTLYALLAQATSGPPTLAALGGTFSLAENAAASAVAGSLTNKRVASTLSLTDDAGGRVALSGSNVIRGATALNYEGATSHSFTVRETLAEATNSPRDTVLSLIVSNVLEAATLGTLALDDTSVPEDSAATINITGATTGSTLTVQTGSLPTGMTLDSGARTIAGTPTTAATSNFTLRETLADSPNSPNDTALSIEVTVGAGTLDPTLTAPVLSLAVGATTYPPEFDVAFDDTVVVGDTLHIAWANPGQAVDGEGFFTATVGTASNTIDGAEAAANALNMALSGIASGTYNYQAWIVQADADYSAPSNTVQHGPDVTAPVLTSPVSASTGTTTGSVGVTTDTAEGTLYYVLTTSATPPSKAQVKAGQNHSGAAASWAGSQAITTTGAKTANATGLTQGTTYYAYFMHEDAATNQSTVAAASSFATDASNPVTLHSTHAFDTVDKGFSSTSHTFAAGDIGTAQTNRVCLACIVAYEGGGNHVPATVTIGGVSATLVDSSGHMSMWRAAVPTGTTADVVADLGGSFNIGWMGCILHSIRTGTAAPASTAKDAFASDGTNPAVSTTRGADSLTIAYAAKDATGVTASWTNATAAAFKANMVWSIGTATRTTADTATITAGGWSGSTNGLLTATWAP